MIDEPMGGELPTGPRPLNAADYERAAAALLAEGVLGYFAGGAGDERTLEDNVSASARRRLRPRILVGVSTTTRATTVLGTPYRCPCCLRRLASNGSPIATARSRAPARPPPRARSTASRRWRRQPPRSWPTPSPAPPTWFQLYPFRDRGVTRALIDEAAEAGCRATVLTADTARTGRRERGLRTGFELGGSLHVPALERVLHDRARGHPGTLGQRGVDVAVMHALGARAVLIGRPFVWALAVGGRPAVEHLLPATFVVQRPSDGSGDGGARIGLRRQDR
ncbi:MAG: alpha-hydroxy-acid oxidizing protein [Solirubrobacteraceae bacterium]